VSMIQHASPRLYAAWSAGLLVSAVTLPWLHANENGQGPAAQLNNSAAELNPVGIDYAHLPVPQIGVRQEDLAPLYKVRTHVWVRMPQIDSYWNVLDLNIYEEPRDLVFLGPRRLAGGALELRHRRSKPPHLLVVTSIIPEPGRVRIVARAELDPGAEGDQQIPEPLPALNICCNARRSRDAFDSHPDPFTEFVTRSFIFTDRGRTFLNDTVRRRLPRAALDDPRNNPPWIQDYSPVWLPTRQPVTGNTWYNCSPDRYTIPVIGVVSRDGRHLAALASDSSNRLCQAWGPCIHNYPAWTPPDATPAERRWRMNLYIMPNDPDSLLRRVALDFPLAPKLKAKRVP
jgi:hypothetical protein